MLRVESSTRRRRARLLGVLTVAVLAVGAAACAPAPPTSPVYDSACNGTMVELPQATVASNAVTELSGLAASRTNAGVWWGHNDSGTAPDAITVFAIGDAGQSYAQFTLNGVANTPTTDWEDIAVGPGPTPGVSYVYVGDIGGNISPRHTVLVHRFPEPLVDTSKPPQPTAGIAAETLTFTYPGTETHDAEALISDPATGELFLITKTLSPNDPARVFRAGANLSAGSTTELEQVATLPYPLITGADVTAAGDVVAVRTYFSVLLFARPAGTSLADAFGQPMCFGSVPAKLAQFESIAFTPDGRGYVTAAEGLHPTLFHFAAP